MNLIPFAVTENSVLVIGKDADKYVLLIKAAGINLPVGIGEYDAKCIISLLQDGEADIDSAHDLPANIFTALEVPFTKVAITEIVKEEFQARIYFQKEGVEVSLAALLGDAIILALGLKAPMFIEEEVLINGTEGDGPESFLADVAKMMPEVLGS
jgi:bifunctional DNase/RNase